MANRAAKSILTCFHSRGRGCQSSDVATICWSHTSIAPICDGRRQLRYGLDLETVTKVTLQPAIIDTLCNAYNVSFILKYQLSAQDVCILHLPTILISEEEV